MDLLGVPVAKVRAWLPAPSLRRGFLSETQAAPSIHTAPLAGVFPLTSPCTPSVSHKPSSWSVMEEVFSLLCCSWKLWRTWKPEGRVERELGMSTDPGGLAEAFPGNAGALQAS